MQTSDPVAFLVQELSLPKQSVSAAIQLFSAGNTVPFIARYRKEVTNNLDEIQLRTIQERLNYLQELNERKKTILSSIESQGKLTEMLRDKINGCAVKTELEDLYLPYKPKRKTRASIAREKGLEPLAMRILEQPLEVDLLEEASAFINNEHQVTSAAEALSYARDIVAEIVAENAQVRALVREAFFNESFLVSKAVKGKDSAPTKFEQYYQFKEAIREIPSHRYLAMRRGESEEILELSFELEADSLLVQISTLFKFNKLSPYAENLEKAVAESYKRLIVPSIETEMRVELKLRSDREAVNIFAENLKNLLMMSPLGNRSVIGIDPGLRTGCKCAAVDETGKYLDSMVLYLCQGEQQMESARQQLLNFISKYHPFAIAVGNGTGGREAELFIRRCLSDIKESTIIVTAVSEAGASVYSASDLAREEFPDLDLTVRGAISIARRLQDPLAELVKTDPKSIGVGQYQHDVYQQLLQDKLSEVVESCVNRVGVELNTASSALLSYVSGIGSSMALKIVKYREKNGAFRNRKQLLDIPGLGIRTYEQAAGFLRIHGADYPLDASAVHPERYSLVELIAQDLGIALSSLIANARIIQQIDIKKYYSKEVGEHTLKDIVEELNKPGRDPRAAFERLNFREDVQSMKDLKVGMLLEGVVTNVTAFGAFVDIGVHQDGLIHLSELSDKFIKDPKEVVQVGNKLTVRVLDIDIARNRIALTARKGEAAAMQKQRGSETNRSSPKARQKVFNHNPFSSL
jgi:protein Tex